MAHDDGLALPGREARQGSEQAGLLGPAIGAVLAPVGRGADDRGLVPGPLAANAQLAVVAVGGVDDHPAQEGRWVIDRPQARGQGGEAVLDQVLGDGSVSRQEVGEVTGTTGVPGVQLAESGRGHGVLSRSGSGLEGQVRPRVSDGSASPQVAARLRP